MFEAVEGLVEEHAQIQQRLADPAVYQDQGLARKLGRRGAELNAVVETYHRWKQMGDDLEAAREMASLDPEFAAEAEELESARPEVAERLRRLLIPRDPNDARDAILEVKGGEGGEEAALFAADLLRMYTRYAESRGWKVEMISSTDSDLGGYKD
ncbi:MAG: PCRF domain-containing protein, partial [Galactobacter sp.]